MLYQSDFEFQSYLRIVDWIRLVPGDVPSPRLFLVTSIDPSRGAERLMSDKEGRWPVGCDQQFFSNMIISSSITEPFLLVLSRAWSVHSDVSVCKGKFKTYIWWLKQFLTSLKTKTTNFRSNFFSYVILTSYDKITS